MGLSVLIPVYNQPVDLLVQSLSARLERSGRKGEIIILDDGSDPEMVTHNRELTWHFGVSFHANEKNEGRMAARIRLAGLAKYNYLLFLDADSQVINSDFLTRYFEKMEQEALLVSGGRLYSSTPAPCEFRLHWKYGTLRETRTSTQLPAFMSNNFMVKKDVFNKLDHSLLLTGYGHEDSWWGIQFEMAGIQCQYINNAILHGELQNSVNFLEKSEAALSNLLLLEKHVNPDLLKKHIRIYRWWKKLKGVGDVYLFLEKPFHGIMKKNLISCKPSLFYFDCYRLAVLMRLAKN